MKNQDERTFTTLDIRKLTKPKLIEHIKKIEIEIDRLNSLNFSLEDGINKKNDEIDTLKNAVALLEIKNQAIVESIKTAVYIKHPDHVLCDTSYHDTEYRPAYSPETIKVTKPATEEFLILERLYQIATS